jgi:hypothetical protein
MRECRASKENAAAAQGKNLPQKAQKEESRKEASYASMSWTACYDDACQTHLSEKDGVGYWPRLRSSEKVVFGITQQGQVNLREEDLEGPPPEYEMCGNPAHHPFTTRTDA